MSTLRSKLIRLAYLRPEIRQDLLPLLKTAKDQWAKYKGKNYRLLYIGPTRYGQRARLEFADGSKDFWVDANLVDVSSGPPVGLKYECSECGEYVRPGTRCWETGALH